MLMEVETYHEFKEKHSKDGESVIVGNKEIFPDGAACTADGFGERGGRFLYDPPHDPIERLKMQKLYAVERVAQLRRDFRKRHDVLSAIAREAALVQRENAMDAAMGRTPPPNRFTMQVDETCMYQFTAPVSVVEGDGGG